LTAIRFPHQISLPFVQIQLIPNNTTSGNSSSLEILPQKNAPIAPNCYHHPNKSSGLSTFHPQSLSILQHRPSQLATVPAQDNSTGALAGRI
jgi:hypothetical protein